MNRLERSIQDIVEERKLSSPDEISTLSDSEILQCSGIGGKTLHNIRRVYPRQSVELISDRGEFINEEMLLKALAEAMNGPDLSAIWDQRLEGVEPIKVQLGSVHDVSAARLVQGNVLIQSGTPKIQTLIEIEWLSNFKAKGAGYDSGFGELTAVRECCANRWRPKIGNVTEVFFGEIKKSGTYGKSDVIIRSPFLQFSIDLYCDALELDCESFENSCDGLSFAEEVSSDRALRRLAKSMEPLWNIAEAYIRNKKPIEALKSLVSVADIAAEFSLRVRELAEVREVKVDDDVGDLEHIFETEDHERTTANRKSNRIVSASQVFPFFLSPAAILERSFRIILQGRVGKDFDNACSLAKNLPADLIPDLDRRLARYEAIMSEVRVVRQEIRKAGLSGLLRKDVISRSERRFPNDGNALRALKRWINASAQRGEILKIQGRDGQILRMPL